jgi:hypothetical protein
MICALIPWTKSITHLKYRFRSSTGRYRGRAQARQAANTDSICQLVDHRPFDRMKDNRDENRVRFAAYDYAFVALWLASFAFGIAGADVLLALAMEAKNKARAMGQEAALGSGTYRMSLSLALIDARGSVRHTDTSSSGRPLLCPPAAARLLPRPLCSAVPNYAQRGGQCQ